ncbi:hypothetical protein LPJ68_005478 [Coemansia sp. RSA 1086]|nr:hypothetical protein LPJ68_005478 [Coemansia sp. RSA 1086]
MLVKSSFFAVVGSAIWTASMVAAAASSDLGPSSEMPPAHFENQHSGELPSAVISESVSVMVSALPATSVHSPSTPTTHVATHTSTTTQSETHATTASPSGTITAVITGMESSESVHKTHASSTSKHSSSHTSSASLVSSTGWLVAVAMAVAMAGVASLAF